MPGKLLAYKEKGYIGLFAGVSAPQYNDPKRSVKDWGKVAKLYANLILAQGAKQIRFDSISGFFSILFPRKKKAPLPATRTAIVHAMENSPWPEFVKDGKVVALFEIYSSDGADLKLYGATKAAVEKAAKKAGFKLEWGSRPAVVEA